jgi:uncharacterized membrane protein YphA (DoxX/SURF4 family)
LQRLFSKFLSGSSGLGLLILRLTVGLTVIAEDGMYLTGGENSTTLQQVLGLSAIIIGGLMMLGFLTPFVGFFIFVGSIFLKFSPPSTNFNILATIYLIVMSLAIILLGPGVFSLDALFFGRREIIIPDNPRMPKKSK